MRLADHYQASQIGRLIEVDFVHRRRVAPRRSHVVDVMSFSQEREGLVPQSLRTDGRLLLIWEILDRWPAHDYRYYKVRTTEDVVVFLRHDARNDIWTLITQ